MTAPDHLQAPPAATTPPFDFAAATLRVLNDFPQMKKNTVFLRTDTPHQAYGHWKARLAGALTAQALHSRRQIAQAQSEDSSYAFQKSRWGAQLQSLVFKPDDSFSRQLGDSAGLAQAQAYGFNHELGHLVVARAHGPMPHGKPYPENAADSYATLRHLQDNKADMLLPLVNSWARAYRFVAAGSAVHMTSTSIEAVLSDHLSDPSALASLDGKALARLAEEYAERHAPDAADIDEARFAAYGRFRGRGQLFPFDEGTEKRLLAFAESALGAENKFAFQVGLTVFRPFLHPAGVEINGVQIRIDDTQRENLVQRFEDKAQSLGIRSLIREWQENVDSLCPSAVKTDAGPRAPLRPLKLSLQ